MINCALLSMDSLCGIVGRNVRANSFEPIVLARPLNTEAYLKNRNEEWFRIFVNSVVKQCCSSLVEQIWKIQRNVNEKDKAKGKDSTCLPVLNLPLWSSHHQFFWARRVITDVGWSVTKCDRYLRSFKGFKTVEKPERLRSASILL